MRIKRLGIFQKFFFVSIILLSLLLLVVSLIAQGLFRGYMLEAQKGDLFHQAITIADFYSKAGFFEDTSAESFINGLAEKTGTRVTVVDTSGVVLVDSHYDAKLMENHSDRAEISLALQGFSGESQKFSATLGKEFIYVAVPIKNGSEVVGVVRTSVPFQDLGVAFNKFNKILMMSAFVALIIIGILSYILSYRMSKNLNEMSLLAGEIADGNFSRELQINSTDEIGSLAIAFNRMATRLSQQIIAIGQERSKLTTVLNGISDSVIAVDNKLKLLVFNPAASSLFPELEEKRIGFQMIESIRNNEIYECVKKVIESGSCLRKELIIKDQFTYSVTVAPIIKEDGVILGAVLSMRDISDAKALELIKSQFVANVSHELKTPLTSIKGFVETLLDETEDGQSTQKHFLNIILEETDNLTNMVNDLLNLSEIEAGKIPLNYSLVNLHSLVERCSLLLDGLFEKQGITFTNSVDASFTKIFADTYRIQQLLINLLDNAAKYAPHGIIEVSARKNDNGVEIIVADNGKGIPLEDQPRLFERFYRVDKDRARETGGTGLGLAIVKHIAMAHNGNVAVESTPGHGTKIKVFLPERCLTA